MLTIDDMAKAYEVDSIPEYVYESHKNGQITQVIDLLQEIRQLEDYTVKNLMTDLIEYYLVSPNEALYFVMKYVV